jgi:hypothetical protein
MTRPSTNSAWQLIQTTCTSGKSQISRGCRSTCAKIQNQSARKISDNDSGRSIARPDRHTTGKTHAKAFIQAGNFRPDASQPMATIEPPLRRGGVSLGSACSAPRFPWGRGGWAFSSLMTA